MKLFMEKSTLSESQSPARIFSNPILEALTKTTPALTVTTYGGAIIGLLVMNHYYSNITEWQTVVTYFTGIFFWTLFEYLAHRYAFHYEGESYLAKRFHYIIHGVHHENPRDKHRIMMPPVPGLLIISLFFAVFYLMLGKYSFAFTAAWVNGYLFYSYIHYQVHVAKPVRALKFLWTHHALHHYQQEDKAFGVSSPFWDYVFGTMPAKQQTKGGVVEAKH
jgi:sterol desaturase/sphingolipid hydroxylase (fatty acid hydroxylase superfamily)